MGDASILADYLSHLRLFSRNARLFLAGTFFFGFGFGTFWVLLNLYLRELGYTDTLIGRIISFQSLGTVIAALVVPPLALRVRYKWLLMGAAVLSGTAYTTMALMEAAPALVACSALAGAGFTVHHITAAPFFMRNSRPKERMYLFGMNWALEMLASIIGIAGGGWLARHLGVLLDSPLLGLRFTLLGAGLLVALALIPYFALERRGPSSGATPTESDEPRDRRLLVRLVVPGFLVGAGAGLIIPFLNLYFRDRFGLPTDQIGWIFAVGQAITTVGYLAGPVLAQRLGMIQLVVAAEMLSIPFFLTLAFTQSLPVALVAFWMRGALMNMNHPVTTNFAMEAVGPRHQAFTNATLMLAWNASWWVSTQTGGALIERHGFTVPILGAVVLYLLSSSLYLTFFHDYEKRVLVPRRLREETPEAPVPVPGPPAEAPGGIQE